MIVTPIERLRYNVKSRSGNEPYLVDVGSNRHWNICLGKCDCQGFSQSLFPAFREWLEQDKVLLPEIAENFRCAHIKAARAYAFDELLDRFVTQVRTEFNDYEVEEQ
jgi:hypothetical protein